MFCAYVAYFQHYIKKKKNLNTINLRIILYIFLLLCDNVALELIYFDKTTKYISV